MASRYEVERTCSECDKTYTTGHDKKGVLEAGNETYCPDCAGELQPEECMRCGCQYVPVDGETVCSDCWDRAMDS